MISKIESKFLYKPSLKYVDFSLVGYNYQFIRIQTSDHIILNGLLMESEQAEYYILYFGDNTGNISHQIDHIKKFCDNGFSVLAIDYRGYGKSDGSPSEDGLYEDASSAYQYLTKQRGINSEKIIILGRSLGGAIAIELATRVPAKSLIVESSFISLHELQRDRMPFIPLWIILPNRYNSLDRISKIGIPILFLHGEMDSSIPLRHSTILFGAATTSRSKQMIILRGSDHYNTFQNADYIYYIATFMDGIK